MTARKLSGADLSSCVDGSDGSVLRTSSAHEQSTQNWSGQGESDCLIKTKHCDG